MRAFALFGDTTGELGEHGLPVRRNWAASYRGEALVVYGHTPVRGGAHFASRGRALLLDMNGYGDEYAYLTLTFAGAEVGLELRGVFFSMAL